MGFSKEEKKLFEDMRNLRLGNGKQVARRIKKLYEKNNGKLSKKFVSENTSKIIEEILVLQKDDYENVRNDIIENWLKIVLNNKNKYPETYKKISPVQDTTDLLKISKIISEFAAKIEHSNRQAGKSRAGTGLENQLSLVFDILGVQYESQKEIKGFGEIFDFIFPNAKSVTSNPSHTIIGESQTSFADRHRLSLGKASGETFSKVGKVVFSMSGDNIISSKGKSDFSDSKVREIKSKGYILVVLKRIKEQFFLHDEEVISYEKFVNSYYPSRVNNS